MMGKLIPVLLALVGLAVGVGAGMIFRPDAQETSMINPCGEEYEKLGGKSDEPGDSENADTSDVVYVKLNNQFVVPVVFHGNVKSLVVLSLTLEVSASSQDQIYQHEPKLRDAFLQVLFEHANSGGFDGAFTSGRNMSLLRDALLEVATKTFGNRIRDILIVDLVRQDV